MDNTFFKCVYYDAFLFHSLSYYDVGSALQVLGRVDALRKRITSVGKQHASVCAKVRIICKMIYILITVIHIVFCMFMLETHVPELS